MNNKNWIILALVALSSVRLVAAPMSAGPSKVPPTPAASNTSKPGTLATPLTVVTPAKAIPSYMTYSYYGERYRDPFIPLNGDVATEGGYERAPAIVSLSLKGIVQDANGRMALLTSGVSSYILRGGRLYDGRNRMVKKISGVIKTDSVILIGADHTVRELRTKATL